LHDVIHAILFYESIFEDQMLYIVFYNKPDNRLQHSYLVVMEQIVNCFLVRS